MRTFQFIILVCLLFTSCDPSKEDNPKSNNNKKNNKPEIPNESCDKVSWGNLPVITHGYSDPDHEKVLVETYIKNSNFDSLIGRFELRNDAKIRDTHRQERSFNLPSEINSTIDIKITIGSDEYLITEVKTGWIPRYGHEFIGYGCKIQNFLINGEKESGNIHLKNEQFNPLKNHLEMDMKRIMISSGIISPYTDIVLANCPFQLVKNQNKDTIYLSTNDPKFTTPEGYKVGDDWAIISKSETKKIERMNGWGYFIPLESGWQLGFCEGQSCTDTVPKKGSHVKWIFKRENNGY